MSDERDKPKCYKRLMDVTPEDYARFLKTGEHPLADDEREELQTKGLWPMDESDKIFVQAESGISADAWPEPTPKPTGARELPKCPHYIAHPQSVWFEEHWRPAYDALSQACIARAQEKAWATLERDQALTERTHFEVLARRQLTEIAALKAENASLYDQLQWSLKNEQQYKDALKEWGAENERLREALEKIKIINDRLGEDGRKIYMIDDVVRKAQESE